MKNSMLLVLALGISLPAYGAPQLFRKGDMVEGIDKDGNKIRGPFASITGNKVEIVTGTIISADGPNRDATTFVDYKTVKPLKEVSTRFKKGDLVEGKNENGKTMHGYFVRALGNEAEVRDSMEDSYGPSLYLNLKTVKPFKEASTQFKKNELVEWTDESGAKKQGYFIRAFGNQAEVKDSSEASQGGTVIGISILIDLKKLKSVKK